MHAALLRRGNIQKENFYALNKGDFNDMGFCDFEEDSFNLKL